MKRPAAKTGKTGKASKAGKTRPPSGRATRRAKRSAPPKRPPGRIRTFLLRRIRTFLRSQGRRWLRRARWYLVALVLGAAASIAAGSWWPVAAVAIACVVIAADRMIEHWLFVHRRGGRVAARRRRRHEGLARPGALALSVSLAAVRHKCKHLRPSLDGRTRRLPPNEAGIELGRIVRTR
jgi:hypothetical protein